MHVKPVRVGSSIAYALLHPFCGYKWATAAGWLLSRVVTVAVLIICDDGRVDPFADLRCAGGGLREGRPMRQDPASTCETGSCLFVLCSAQVTER